MAELDDAVTVGAEALADAIDDPDDHDRWMEFAARAVIQACIDAGVLALWSSSEGDPIWWQRRAEAAEVRAEEAERAVTAMDRRHDELVAEVLAAEARVAELTEALRELVTACDGEELHCWTPVGRIADEYGTFVEDECWGCPGCRTLVAHHAARAVLAGSGDTT